MEAAGVGTMEQTKKVELKIEKSDGTRLDLKNREGAYWKGWDDKDIKTLIGALRTIRACDRTYQENDLLTSDDIMRGRTTVPGTGFAGKYMLDQLRQHKLSAAEIAYLRTKKVKAIHNASDRGKELAMPPGSGATVLIIPGKGTGKNNIPDGGYHILDAYTEQFIDPDQVKAAGLQLVDYDPANENMNPPKTTSGRMSLGYDAGAPVEGQKREIGKDKETERIEAEEKRLSTPANVAALQEALASQG